MCAHTKVGHIRTCLVYKNVQCTRSGRTASTVGEECAADTLSSERRMSVHNKWAPDSVDSAGTQLSPGSMSAASTTTGTSANRRPWQHGGVHSPSSGASSATRPQSAQSFRTGVSGGSASPTRAVYICSNYGNNHVHGDTCRHPHHTAVYVCRCLSGTGDFWRCLGLLGILHDALRSGTRVFLRMQNN